MTDAHSPRYQKIMVPVDGSAWSQRAIPHAMDLARLHGAQVILLHVFVPPAPEFVPELALASQTEHFDHMRDEARVMMHNLEVDWHDGEVKVRGEVIEGFDVSGLISDYARQQHVDLIVMSTHGRSGISRLIFGSVAKGVMDHCKVPTLLIHPEKEELQPV